jgi:hypothetical protein
MTQHYTTTLLSGMTGAILASLCCAATLRPYHASAQCDLTITPVVTQPTCGLDDGIIQLLFAEGTEIYMIEWSNGYQGSYLTDLPAGHYSVTVIDWNMCETTYEVELDGCPEEEDPDPGICMFRTQTQGGWGSSPNGNNPGAYLQANFAAAFPNGLEIGCNNRKLRLTSAEAVRNYLPAGGPAGKLPAGTLVNPTKYKNVLAAQLVTATLSVGLDARDPIFGIANMTLGAAIIQQGPFAGLTVQQLLDAANAFIGDCGGNGHSASAYNEALSAINENYVDGTTDNGFLGCGAMGEKMLSQELVASVHPNPASSTLFIWLNSKHDATVGMEMLDATGRVVSPRIVRDVAAGIVEQTMDVSLLPEGMYFLRTDSNNKTSIQRIIVVH